MPNELLPVLCIGGLDPSGGAGLLADARACAAFGAYALGVATAIVPQNTVGVAMVEPVAPQVIDAQLRSLLEDVTPAAVKIGMLPGIAAADVVFNNLRTLRRRVSIVVDPVFAPSTGPEFSNPQVIEFIADELLPLADIVTPNSLEARQLGAEEITDLDSMARACLALFERTHARHVLLKGGHVILTEEEMQSFSTDLLFDGTRFLELRAPRETGYEVRGTGCMLAAAIAAQMADGKLAVAAARGAKVWLTTQIRKAGILGQGRRVAP